MRNLPANSECLERTDIAVRRERKASQNRTAFDSELVERINRALSLARLRRSKIVANSPHGRAGHLIQNQLAPDSTDNRIEPVSLHFGQNPEPAFITSNQVILNH
jgi:hypothetical protein